MTHSTMLTMVSGLLHISLALQDLATKARLRMDGINDLTNAEEGEKVRRFFYITIQIRTKKRLKI